MLTLQICFQDFQLIISHIHIGNTEDRAQHRLCCCILCLQLWLISLGMKNRNQTRCLLCLMLSGQVQLTGTCLANTLLHFRISMHTSFSYFYLKKFLYRKPNHLCLVHVQNDQKLFSVHGTNSM